VTRRDKLLAAALLAAPTVFLSAWFVAPLAELFANAFADPEGPLAPFERLITIGVYRRIFFNTILLAVYVTVTCVLLAYPVAYVLSRLKGGLFMVVLYCVLFPLWVSVLVRTFSWMLLLETNGPLNRALVDLSLVGQPLQLLFNDTGVFIGMVHVLLPYALIPIYTVMSRIDDRLLMASDGLGASLFDSFRRVYLPLTLPGVAGGGAFVFLLALGFFITPALLGGINAISLSMLIEQFVNEQLNWPMAAAASILLLGAVLLILAAFARFLSFGRESMTR